MLKSVNKDLEPILVGLNLVELKFKGEGGSIKAIKINLEQESKAYAQAIAASTSL